MPTFTKSWLDFEHPYYVDAHARYVYARDHYTARVLDADTIDTYLIARAVGEAPEAYAERKRLADYTPHFGALVDSLAGMLFGNDGDATRVWGALGVPTDATAKSAGLWHDAGNGLAYATIWKRLAIELTAIQRAWILVDGGSTGRVRVLLVEAERVPNWIDGADGYPLEVLVHEDADTRTDLEDDARDMNQWVRFTTTGWTRYRRDAETGNPVATSSGTYRYIDPMTGVPILPIFPVDLALPRPVGYVLARKANAIFNQESARDNLVRQANFPYLNVFGSDTAFKKVVEAMKAGARALQNPQAGTPHGFIAPSAEPATVASAVLTRKVEEFWRVGFREYEDAAVEKTATEVRQDVASGVGAYLTLLKSSVDAAENRTLLLLEQTFFPNDRGKWQDARVERSDDFVPFDINQTIERLRTRYFGAAAIVPASRDARIEAARQIAEWDGLDTDPAAIALAVDAAAIAAALDALRDLPIPADGRAELAIKFLEATGFDVEAAGGREALLAQARELAGATDTNAMRSAAALGGGAFDDPAGAADAADDEDTALSPDARAAAERNQFPPE